MDWVLPLRTPFFNGFFELVTLAGYPLFLIMFLCFGYFALGSKRFFHTAMLLMAAGLLNSWLKDFGQDPRPDALYALDGRVGDSYGWPSGHTQIAVVLWGYLAYTMRQIGPMRRRRFLSLCKVFRGSIWACMIWGMFLGFHIRRFMPRRLYCGARS